MIILFDNPDNADTYIAEWFRNICGNRWPTDADAYFQKCSVYCKTHNQKQSRIVFQKGRPNARNEPGIEEKRQKFMGNSILFINRTAT